MLVTVYPAKDLYNKLRKGLKENSEVFKKVFAYNAVLYIH